MPTTLDRATAFNALILAEGGAMTAAFTGSCEALEEASAPPSPYSRHWTTHRFLQRIWDRWWIT